MTNKFSVVHTLVCDWFATCNLWNITCQKCSHWTVQWAIRNWGIAYITPSVQKEHWLHHGCFFSWFKGPHLCAHFAKCIHHMWKWTQEKQWKIIFTILPFTPFTIKYNCRSFMVESPLIFAYYNLHCFFSHCSSFSNLSAEKDVLDIPNFIIHHWSMHCLWKLWC